MRWKLAWSALSVIASLTGGARAADISVTQWGNSLSGLPYAVALEQHLFQRAGVDVTGVIGSGGGGTTVRNVLASELPYGEVALSAALAAARQGLDVIIVNVGYHSLADSMVVTLPNSPIHSIEDLAGKKVAVTSARGVSEMVLLMAMRARGLDPSSVSRTMSGGYGQGLTMLDHDAVVAASLLEPLYLPKKDRYRVLFNADEVLPPMVVTVGITTAAFAKANPAIVRGLIAGRRAAVRAIYADPAASEPALVNLTKMQPEIAHETLVHMVKVQMWSEGGFVQPELDRIADGLRLVGEIDGPVDWNAIIDRSYLPDDLRQ
jgi:NitT/TauT family transport system substrate-binding protein